ncbi:MAG: hypothetical protein FWE07_05375 [Turicibacter sp.]|nr:hypothetical protein [Turicibacter sp.]
MKKRFFALILVLFGLIGCSSENDALNDNEIREVSKPEVSIPAVSLPENDNNSTHIEGLGDFTFSEGRSYSDDRDTGVDVMSLEEAAQIGADYIFEVLGENLDGAHIELAYNYNPHIPDRTWFGLVSHPDRRVSGSRIMISFLIDAQTGERFGLSYWQLEDLQGISGEMMETMPIEELLEIFPEPDESEIAEMLEVAREIAERHLQTSEIAIIEYGFSMGGGEADTTYHHPSQLLPFFVIDSEGRLIEIFIQRETHILWKINVPPF